MSAPISSNTYLHYAFGGLSLAGVAGGGVIAVLGGLGVFGHLWGVGSISSVAGGGSTFLLCLAATAGTIVVMYHNHKQDKHNIVHYISTLDAASIQDDQEIDVNARDKTGQTPLHHCVNPALAAKLIEKGADINAKDNNGCTPLHYAVTNLPLLEELLKHKPKLELELDAKDNYGSTPLHKARIPAVIDALVRAGAEVDARDANGKTPLFHAQVKDTIDALVRNGADVNAVDNFGRTPIVYAVKYKNKEAFEPLVDLADLTLRDKEGNTLLHIAAKSKSASILAALLEKKKIDVNATNRKLDTALHIAARQRLPTSYQGKYPTDLLIDAGARRDLLNKAGEIPLRRQTDY